FSPPISYATGGLDTIFPNTGGPIRVNVADVNGDGHVDVLVANWCQGVNACTKSNVGVLLNRGNGTFQPVVTYDSGGPHAFSVSVTDMNSDGIPDLIVANGCADDFQVPGCPDGVASSDADGRHYTVTVAAKDNAGNDGSAVTVVTVPHDRRR